MRSKGDAPERGSPTLIGVPTVLRLGPYRFFFYAADNREPPHIHVQRDRLRTKVWLGRVELASNTGFTRRELLVIVRVVRDNERQLRQGWDVYFRD